MPPQKRERVESCSETAQLASKEVRACRRHNRTFALRAPIANAIVLAADRRELGERVKIHCGGLCQLIERSEGSGPEQRQLEPHRAVAAAAREPDAGVMRRDLSLRLRVVTTSDHTLSRVAISGFQSARQPVA